MDADVQSLNQSESDFSAASNLSPGRSTQPDLSVSSESTPLLCQNQHSDRRPAVGTSWYASIFLVVNAALGAGLLNFPAAYHECGGILVAVTVQAVLAVFIFASMIVLIYCAQVHSCATYQDVVFACCGRVARGFCSAAIILYAFGTCITFFIIIGDQWSKFLSLVYGPTFCDNCAVGVVAVLYCVFLVTFKYFFTTLNTDRCPIRHRPETWIDVFTVVPVICFGYQCHLSLVPIFACTRERRLVDFTKTIIIALFLCCLSYTVTASFGYLTFGACVRPDILSSYSPTADVLVAVIIIAIKMYTTYPIMLYVGRVAIDSMWLEVCKQTPDIMELLERRRRVITTLIWFSTSLLIAFFVPDIGVVISLLGGLAAIFIFIFPGICLLQSVLNNQPTAEVQCKVHYVGCIGVASACLVFGGFIFGVTTTQSLIKDSTGFTPNLRPISHNMSDYCW